MRPRSLPSRTLPLVGLVVVNLLPLVGVLEWGWNLHTLLVAYWLENGIIGASYVAKMLLAEGDASSSKVNVTINNTPVEHIPSWAGKLVLVGFFCFHYGIFWVVHGVFVFTFGLFVPGGLGSPEFGAVALAGGSFVVSHAVSFVFNYVRGGERERASPAELMTEPYRRVVVLHLTIVGGAFAAAYFGGPIGVLVILVLVKTAVDVMAHLHEHARARERPPSRSKPV